MDYSHLKGREIHVPGLPVPLVVTEIEDGVGITLHLKDNLNTPVFCIVHTTILAKRLGLPLEKVGTEEDFKAGFSMVLDWISVGRAPHIDNFPGSRISEELIQEACPFK